MKRTVIAAAAFALLATSSEAADYRTRAREHFCITRGGCLDHDAIMKKLEAKDNARHMEAERLNAIKREQAEAEAAIANERAAAQAHALEQERLAAEAARQEIARQKAIERD